MRPPTRLRLACALLAGLAPLCPVAGRTAATPLPPAAALETYAGRYLGDDGTLVRVYPGSGRLVLRPVLWTTPQYLLDDGADRFVVEGRPDRRVRFLRDGSGRIHAATLGGIGRDGIYRRIEPTEPLPVERLLAGDGNEAALRLLAGDPCGAETAVELAGWIVRRIPSRTQAAVELLVEVVRRDPANAAAWTALGNGLVALGDRPAAGAAYRAALAADPARAEARLALGRLDPPPLRPPAGWSLPFPLAELFESPTDQEIAAVARTWAARDLAPRDVEVVETATLDLGSAVAELRVLSHRVHGSRHFGAVLVPRGATPGCCPVIVEAKGISWDYFPLDLRQVPYAPRILGDAQGHFVYLLPSFRGETLLVGDRGYTSEGDRSDGFDGATDDAIAFLGAALAVTPEADPSRIAAFGKSRGGSVALLLGERDRRIDRVVDWVGPTDWFGLMAEGGWSQAELVAEGLRQRSAPDQVGGQFIERFLRGPIAGTRAPPAARAHLIASSPLYFADRLPRTQLHYGEEDAMVPAINGRVLLDRLARHAPGCAEAFFYPDAGHDLEPAEAFARSRRFLLELLAEDPSPCRPPGR